MKRLQLPQNKFLKLFINIALLQIWFYMTLNLFYRIYFSIVYITGYFLYSILLFLILVIPIAILTKALWFPKRPKITGSKD